MGNCSTGECPFAPNPRANRGAGNLVVTDKWRGNYEEINWGKQTKQPKKKANVNEDSIQSETNP